MTAQAAEGDGRLPSDALGGAVQPLADAEVWPDGSHSTVLFVLDVRDDEERALLEGRIRASSMASGARSEIATLDEGDGALRRLLAELPEDTWLQPLRLIWLPRPRAGASNLVQDLVALGIENPGPRRRRRILADHPERVRVLRGDGARVDAVRAEALRSWDLEAEGDALAAFVRRQALVVLDRVERNARGARYKVPRLLPEDVFANRTFRARLWQVAQEAERPPAEVEELIRTRPVAFVMSHKSMLDSIALQCVLFDRNQPMPLTFGGINLNTPGIGALAKRAGVIFLRRSFQDNEVY